MRDLVFLPGWTKDEKSYKKLVQLRPSDFRVFIQSYDYLAPHKSLVHFEKRLLKLLDDNKLNKVELAGHSFGGTLAIYFASRHPERLKNLYLIDSAVFTQSPLKTAVNFLKERIRIGPYLNTVAFMELLRKPILNFRLGILALGLNFKDEMRKIKTPTTLIWAEDDVLTPIENAKIVLKSIESSRLISLKDVNHDWIIFNPKLFWKNISK